MHSKYVEKIFKPIQISLNFNQKNLYYAVCLKYQYEL